MNIGRALMYLRAQEWKLRGKFVAGGPFVDPVDGAALVFQDSTPAEVEAFAKDDPCTACLPEYRRIEYQLCTRPAFEMLQ